MQNSLFDMNFKNELSKNAPLADRMRPHTIEDFVGQDHIAKEGKLLYRMIKADKINSLILYGPPGCGKTTLAEIISNSTNSIFVRINAVTSGVADIKNIIKGATNDLSMYQKRTIVFIDEIHRFNKAQQDALLPSVENGTIILIGATTENPYFEINSALISRSTVIELKKLTNDDIASLIKRAILDKQNGLGIYDIEINDDAIAHWSNIADGDCRIALNALELAFLTTPKNKDGKIKIDLTTAQDSIQKKAVKYDKNDSGHYDTISAFIKSMRGSDPDAALYYLAKMLYAGEDPKFIARRMVIFASEDISNADPYALTLAVSVFRAVETIGMPECKINLAHGVTYLACAPKSNASYIGLELATKDIEREQIEPVAKHLRNAVFSAQKKEGVGADYKYPHDYEGHYVPQQYLPEHLKDRKYYDPDGIGYEKKLTEYLQKIKNVYNKKNEGE